MKTKRLFILLGYFIVSLFIGKTFAQGGEICSYSNILSDRTFSLGEVIYSPDWISSSKYTSTLNNGVLSLSLRDKTTDAWQAQFFLSVAPRVPLNIGNSYCISFDIETSIDLPRAFIKFFKEGNNERFIELLSSDIKKGKQNVSGIHVNSGATAVNEIDKFLFDFGYNPAGVSIIISNIEIRGLNIDATNDVVESDKVKISPNPVEDILYINGLTKEVVVKVFDLSGRLCIDTISDNEVDASSLEQGAYFVVVGNTTFKMIKK